MGNQTGLQVPYLVMIGVVAVVAVVVLVMNGSASLQGAEVYRDRTEDFSPYCVDNDDQNHYDVRGTVNFGYWEYYDHCRGAVLQQYYCASSNSVQPTPGYECPNGCLSGVCQ